MAVTLDLVVAVVVRAGLMAVALDVGFVVGSGLVTVALDLDFVVRSGLMTVALDLDLVPLLVRHLAPPSALVPVSGLCPSRRTGKPQSSTFRPQAQMKR